MLPEKNIVMFINAEGGTILYEQIGLTMAYSLVLNVTFLNF
jgi:hypothetical protein